MAMEERELVKICAEKLERALNAADGGLSQRRRDLFDRYQGALEGNERDGYSKFTTREVLEAVEWAMPAIVRIFTAGDKIVSFEPSGFEDEPAADQETDVVNYAVQRANGGDGFLALYSFIKDALVNPTAYAKVYVEEKERSFVRTRNGLLAADLEKLVTDDTIEILEQETETVQAPLMNGRGETALQDVELFNVRIRQTDNKPKLHVIPVPGEEVLVDNEFTSLDLDNAHFVAHRNRKTYSDLIAMGIPARDLESIGGFEDDAEWNDERTHRLFYEDEHPDDEENDPDPTMRTYWVHEIWMWVDYDGDGRAEYRRIFLIGDHVFENEEDDYQPMVAMSSSIVPHKHSGMSLAEMVEDLQRLLTTLTRQLLDNTYKTNTNRKFINEDSLTEDGATMDAMLDPTSEYVPVIGDPRNAVMPEQPVSVLRDILPVIQHAQAATSMRTGVAPENNVDPDVLQKTTYGAFMGAMEKAGERIELIARIMAETGVKQLFRKAHKLCRTYPDIATTVKLRGKWVSVDPLEWPERTDMSVNVGLGFSDKRQLVQMLVQLLAIQKEAMALGIATPQHIYNSLERLVEASDVGAVEQYFISPADPNFQPPQPQPDPQGELFKAQAQAVLMEQQRKGEELKINAQLDARRIGADEQRTQTETAMKAEEALGKREERVLKREEAALKVQELMAQLEETRTQLEKTTAEVANIDADTDLKIANAIKAMAEAGVVSDDAALKLAQTIKTLSEADKVDAEALAAERGDAGDTGDAGSVSRETSGGA